MGRGGGEEPGGAFAPGGPHRRSSACDRGPKAGRLGCLEHGVPRLLQLGVCPSAISACTYSTSAPCGPYSHKRCCPGTPPRCRGRDTQAVRAPAHIRRIHRFRQGRPAPAPADSPASDSSLSKAIAPQSRQRSPPPTRGRTPQSLTRNSPRRAVGFPPPFPARHAGLHPLTRICRYPRSVG